MLRVGLSGGIGSGKSTVSTGFAQRGACVVDADRIAREVVEPGTPALAAIAERFGPQLLGPDGALDRAALAALVFADPHALRDLEAITHPAIWARTAELVAQAQAAAVRVLVHDMPLLVEKGMTGDYHLVVIVGADEDTRVDRLVTQRGLSETDARARIAAQASDDERRAAGDVWLDNTTTPADLVEQVDALWNSRIGPYAAHLASGIRTRLRTATISPPDPTWPAQASRLIARLHKALGERIVTVDHIGSTAVPGLVAKDVIDLQVGVHDLAEADDPAFVAVMREAGYVLVPQVDQDTPHGDGDWAKRLYGGCDPGRIVHVHVRAMGSAGWRWALDFRNRLRTDRHVREAYAAEKVRLACLHEDTGAYADAKEVWFAAYAAMDLGSLPPEMLRRPG